MRIDRKDVDVLVLGAGLAGMRAAMAAKEECPSLRVAVAGGDRKPSGSSFRNLNDRLGVQFLEDDRDKDTFCGEVEALARPGEFDPALVRCLAEESGPRVRDLMDYGLKFQTGEDRELLRHAGCFSPSHRRALVFEDLSHAHGRFLSRLESLNVDLMPGLKVVSILTTPGPNPRAVGAALLSTDKRSATLVRAKAVIAAMGGPAPLFARSMAGPGNPGYSYALLARAGARLANTGFLQFMWYTTQNREFFQAARLVTPGIRIRTSSGDWLSIGRDLPAETQARLKRHGNSRGTHCPVGYGLPDAVVDEILASNLSPGGEVRLHTPERGWFSVVPLAHAGNGGAIIDAMARTTTNGLYACGECATGMHGANRMGGSMILATQVFGRRAGLDAARLAWDSSACPGKRFRAIARRALAPWIEDEQGRSNAASWLKESMQRFAALGGLPGIEKFHRELGDKTRQSRDPQFRIMAEAALTVTAHLADMRAAGHKLFTSTTQAA